jgi:hypothetical protein
MAKHISLCAFTVLALAIFTAFLPAAFAQNTTATATIPAKATTAVAAATPTNVTKSAPPLTAAQIKKINDFLSANGNNKDVGSAVADKLKLPTTTFKHVSLKSEHSNDAHVYGLLPDGGMLFSFINATTAYNYHVDSNFKIIASVAMTNHVPSDIKDPEAGAKVEFIYWAGIADQL